MEGRSCDGVVKGGGAEGLNGGTGEPSVERLGGEGVAGWMRRGAEGWRGDAWRGGCVEGRRGGVPQRLAMVSFPSDVESVATSDDESDSERLARQDPPASPCASLRTRSNLYATMIPSIYAKVSMAL